MIRGRVFDLFDDETIGEILGSLGVSSGGDGDGDGGGDDGGGDDAFAAALWSCLVEPGDAVGGALRSVFGPASALSMLRLDDDQVRRALDEAGFPDPGRLDLKAARARWGPRNTAVRYRTAFRCAATLGVRLVVPGSDTWPTGLDDLELHSPAALWVRGDPALLNSGPGVALVGCRASTAYGEHAAGELADSLVTHGVAVHSGGAYGIDGMAHRATMAAEGTTVAVMAGGVDRFYPAGHHDLLGRVAERGAVIGEAPCGTSPSRWRFLQRNRLLAAMTGATVVVEAGFRSGALNTAGHARALDRPIGAVPGPITSPSSAGCHRLLREPDVTCVTSGADIVQLLEPSLVSSGSVDGLTRPAPLEIRVLDSLGRRAKSAARVAIDTGISEAEVRGVLVALELNGLAEEREHGWVEVSS